MVHCREATRFLDGQMFVEIRQKPSCAYTEAFILTPVAPKDCRSMIVRLPLPKDDLSHLKRVRKHADKTLSLILHSKTGQAHRDEFDPLREEGYQICLVRVPARSPETAAEWNEFNEVWPTKFILTGSPAIEMPEQKIMLRYLHKAKKHGGAIIVDPRPQQLSEDVAQIIATADQEAAEQGHPVNPLATNVLFAIQGVSRLERAGVLKLSTVQQGETQVQQYLCTNYDVYCTKEPTVFEAMALLHSRIRRLVFAETTEQGGITSRMVHALQHTNHRYRAFCLCPATEQSCHDEVREEEEGE